VKSSHEGNSPPQGSAPLGRSALVRAEDDDVEGPARRGVQVDVRFATEVELLTDTASVLSALEQLQLAAIWTELGDLERDQLGIYNTRESLRHAAVQRRGWEANLVRAALFGGDAYPRSRDRYLSARSARGYGSGAWSLAGDAFYGEWLKRELSVQDPGLWQDLGSFVRIERLTQESPVRLALALTSVTTGGVLLAGPLGLAPAVAVALYRVAIAMRNAGQTHDAWLPTPTSAKHKHAVHKPKRGSMKPERA
jgi:hypothetical protein